MMPLPFRTELIAPGVLQAKADDLWDAAKEYARQKGLKYNHCNVEGVAPL